MSALLIIILAGLILGVVLNYLADVLPVKRKLAAPVCVFCGHKLGWNEYLTLKPCPECGKPRMARSWLVPLFSVGVLAWTWFFPPRHVNFWESAAILAFFGLVVIVDIEHRIILHVVNLGGAVIALGIGVSHRGWVETAEGGLAGFVVMLVFYYLGIWYARRMRRRSGLVVEDDEALGFGDVLLGGVIGLLLGWPAVFAGLFFGILAAGLIGGGMVLASSLARRYDALATIPYGPFLVIGAVFTLYLLPLLIRG